MRLAKSVSVGLVTALVTAVVVGAILFWLSIGVTTQSYSYSDAGGGIGAEVVEFNMGTPIIIGLLVGVLGFAWQWNRSRQRLGLQ